eukprot:6491312-Amphidinium_carterae.1
MSYFWKRRGMQCTPRPSSFPKWLARCLGTKPCTDLGKVAGTQSKSFQVEARIDHVLGEPL